MIEAGVKAWRWKDWNMNNIPTVTLNNGVEMPQLGFGVFQIADADECERAVLSALENGYRLIDTAASYGNEESVGKAIRNSGVPREEIFLVTKLWISDAAEGKARAGFDRSLDRLGVEYVDAFLLHQPFGDVFGAWRDLTKLQQEGCTRAIGVSNFKPDVLINLALHSEVTPAINQVEVHPHHQQQGAQNVMQELGVQMMSWAPFAEGLNEMFSEQALISIGAKHGKSAAQVMLRWQLQRGIVAIPKSVRSERQQENIDVFDFELSEGEMTAIAALDRGVSSFFDHRDPETVKRLVNLVRNTD